MDVVRIVVDPIDVGAVYAEVVSPSAGGVSVFVGTTRDNFDGKQVVRLEYEAYESMALREMERLCQEVRKRWTVVKVAMFHRLGVVPVTEASVAIAVSSAHRAEAIAACGFAIDELKARVPIWKKEVYEDGSTWKANSEFQPAEL